MIILQININISKANTNRNNNNFISFDIEERAKLQFYNI
jgi:hypothetical protein